MGNEYLRSAKHSSNASTTALLLLWRQNSVPSLPSSFDLTTLSEPHIARPRLRADAQCDRLSEIKFAS